MQFSLVFGLIFAINVGLSVYSNRQSKAESPDPTEHAQWKSLVKKYLSVYLLATLSDWLQGPYVYALYSAYEYTQPEIAVLFVAGFGSSMLFGSFVGGMADWGGRRRFVILYAVFYALSCLTKHFKSFHVLMLGRLLGGISTSLLFSVFDSWLIRAHADAGLKHYLGKTFSWAAYGNSVIAISAGLIANHFAEAYPMVPFSGNMYVGGYLNPFDIALVVLVGCAVLAATTWEENYGERSTSDKEIQWYDGLSQALLTTIRSQEIVLCGCISALYEGSMFIFVFHWTPALAGVDDLPHGLIFATFMVSCMVGSSLFSIASSYSKPEVLAIGILGVAAASMGLVALSNSYMIKFLGMNLFEVTVGMYWPTYGTLKGMIVPESKRAAIYNLYRIPLNLIVLTSLLAKDISTQTSFSLNAGMLTLATCLQVVLSKAREMHGLTEKDTESGTPEKMPLKDSAV